MRMLVAAIIALLVCCEPAQGQTWRIGDDQPFRTRITSLPRARQETILRSLEPSLQARAKEVDLDSEELAATKRTLLIREISTASGKLTLVQGWGLNLCGGTGNC
jgi:hypothetical protein